MKRNTLGLWVLALALAEASPALGAAPATLVQQGRLYDAAGNPKTGTITMVFNVYASATGGTSLWTETDSVTLDQGYFTVQLGTKTTPPISLWDGSVRYIGITVGSDAEMTPREPVTSVPYALVSALAGNADHATVADSATTTVSVSGTISATQITGTFTPAQLPSIPASQISGTLRASQLPASIPGSLISGPIDGSLVSKVAQANSADSAAGATGQLATTIADLQTGVSTVRSQVEGMREARTVSLGAAGCALQPANPSTVTISHDAIFNDSSATSPVQAICPLPMRLKSTTTITGLTVHYAGTSPVACVVHLVPAPGAVAGSGASYTGSGTPDQFYRSMSLGGPYDSTSFPMAVTCSLGPNSAVRAFSWVETE